MGDPYDQMDWFEASQKQRKRAEQTLRREVVLLWMVTIFAVLAVLVVKG